MMRFIILFVITIVTVSCTVKQQIRPDQQNIPEIRVLLGQVATDSIMFKHPYILQAEEADYSLGEKNSKLYLDKTKHGFKLFNKNRIFTFVAPQSLTLRPQNEGIFTTGGTEFPQKLIISMEDSGDVYLINQLDMQAYLKGVIP
ncbi:MAG: hypothetical protein GF313_00360, partial [Caldithrix sp.]|nr:hypothetical protein [Caldithrix sp.]